MTKLNKQYAIKFNEFKIINQPINKRRGRGPYVCKKYSLRSSRDRLMLNEHIDLRIKYGLRNLKEICVAYSAVDRYRKAYMNARRISELQATAFTELLRSKALIGETQDPLDLKVDYLLRLRLQTVIANASSTIGHRISLSQSRQLITHGHVRVNGRRERITSFRCRPGMVLTINVPQGVGTVNYHIPDKFYPGQ